MVCNAGSSARRRGGDCRGPGHAVTFTRAAVIGSIMNQDPDTQVGHNHSSGPFSFPLPSTP